ncbi:peptidase S8/S53 domain-containing protein [Trichoderma evansii]
MYLAEADVQLFLAIVRAFVDALPPDPKNEPDTCRSQSEHQNRIERHNAIRILRLEVTTLSKDSTKNQVMCDLQDESFEKASKALEDLLYVLDELVDDGILKHNSKDLAPRLPKLHALEALLQSYTLIILSWIKYPGKGAEAPHYDRIAKSAEEFNNIMNNICTATLGPKLTEAEATQISNSSQRNSSYTCTSNARALADLQQAQRLCELAKGLAKVFTTAPKSCRPDHFTYIHLSSFEESQIDMLVSLCGEAKPKWHMVDWTTLDSLAPPDLQQNHIDSICSMLKKSSNDKTQLGIQLHQGGCWKNRTPVLQDRIRNVVAPKKVLYEWLCPSTYKETTSTNDRLLLALNIARSLLCLLGSPLLQSPWESQSILVAEIADEPSDKGLKIKPYILGKLSKCLNDEESKHQFTRAKIAIVHLGLLFWEIFFEEKIKIAKEDQEEGDDKDEISHLFNALHRKVNLSRESFTDISCLDLISNCLTLYLQTSVIDTAFVPSYTKLSSNHLSSLLKVTRHPTRHQQPPPTSSKGNNFGYQQRKTNLWPNKHVLFDADDQTYQQRTHPDPHTEDFVFRMFTFVENNILPLPNDKADDIMSGPLKRNIRIAVLDTGFRVDDEDELVKCGQERILLKRNFLGEDKHAYIDTYGHGTHIVRLLLRFAPYAKIIALEWACGSDCNADIIVMSFGLSQIPDTRLKPSIKRIVEKGKLLFAAASNGGGNEARAYPASEDGVFCIHVSDGKGNKVGINPAPVHGDNFSTLGNAIDSKWDGEEVYINGSSFAVPIAAAIAANALEFIRHTLTDQGDRPEFFYTPLGMKNLFRCLSDSIDGYDYVKPWKRYLWDDERDPADTCSALRAMVTHGSEWWVKRTSEDSFQGFGLP